MTKSSPEAYTIHHFELVNYNGTQSVKLEGLFNSMEIFESIFAPVMYGSVDVVDTNEVLNRFPLIGQETLTISWSSKRDKRARTHTFSVYAITEAIRVEGSTNFRYTLHFASPEMLKSENIVVSKSFDGATSTSIAAQLFKEVKSAKTFDTSEESDVKQNIALPSMTPFEAITWLCSFSQSKNNPGSSYLFFETATGFKFKTLNSLLQRAPVKTLLPILKMLDSATEGDKMDGMSSFKLSIGDLLKASSDDIFYQNLTVVDPLVRKIDRFDYDYQRDYAKFSRLGNSEFRNSAMATLDSEPLKILANKKLKTQATKTISTRTYFVENSYTKSKLPNQSYIKRKESLFLTKAAELNQLDYLRNSVLAPGDSNLNCGDVISVKIPGSVESNKQNTNAYLSGNYLVGSILHSFKQDTYSISLELIKNAFSATIKGVKF